MELTPKKLEGDWFKSSCKIGIELLKRGKVDALLIFVLCPMLIYFIPVTSLKILALGVLIYFGGLFALKYDTHQNVSWWQLSQQFFSISSVVLAALSLLLYVQYATSVDAIDFKINNIVEHLTLTPLLIWFLYIFSLLSMMLSIPVVIVFVLLSMGYKHFVKKEEHKDEDFESSPLPCVPGIFGLFLYFHTDLNWHESHRMCEEGSRAQNWKFYALKIMLIVIMTMLPFMFALSVVIYGIYKHIYFDGTIAPVDSKVADEISSIEQQEA